MINRQDPLQVKAYNFIAEYGYKDELIESYCKDYGDIFGAATHLALLRDDAEGVKNFVRYVQEDHIGRIFSSYSMSSDIMSIFLSEREIPIEALNRALSIAVRVGRIKEAEQLLSQPGVTLLHPSHNMNLLGQAIFNMQVDLVVALTKHLVDNSTSKQRQETLNDALLTAAENHSFQRLLRYHFADYSKDGSIQIRKGNSENDFLKNKKAIEINAQDSLAIVKLLIANGANINASNGKDTVLDLARKAHFFEPVLGYLESVKAEQSRQAAASLMFGDVSSSANSSSTAGATYNQGHR